VRPLTPLRCVRGSDGKGRVMPERKRSIAAWMGVVLVCIALLGLGVWTGRTFLPSSAHHSSEKADDQSATRPPFFRDVTEASGIHFRYRNGQEANHYAILESLGGGVGLIDYDGDGLLDIFLAGGGYFDGPKKDQIKAHPCKLYRNLGGWRFEDVTEEAGLADIAFYNHGCAVADYNRDGWPDLLVTGYGRLALFRNDDAARGGRRFTEVTREAGLRGGHFWSTSAAWGDLDGDGWPELYVCQYVDWSLDNNPACEGYSRAIPRDVCSPKQFEALPHALYRNNRDGTFTNVTRAAGLHTERTERDYDQLTFLSEKARNRLRESDHERDFGKGLGVLILDVNGDGKADIYVANDTTDKFLYLNRGERGQLHFEDTAVHSGVARDPSGLPNGSMGVDAADYDHSGRPSLLVTNYQNELHALYRNLALGAEPVFQFSSQSVGLAGLGRQYVGFGTGFLDIDRDGWQDIVIANGHVIRYPSGAGVRQLPVLLRSRGRQGETEDVRFEHLTSAGGPYFQAEHQGRGLAIGDLDNDGRPDLVISHLNDAVTLLRNEDASEHHWLGLELIGKDHADVVGAKLTLEVDGRRLTHFAKGGASYLSSCDRRHLIGLGDASKVGRLTVVWPSGQEQSWDALAADRYWQLVAGEREAREPPSRGY
jgi:enediyne biosynthesis protein E4